MIANERALDMATRLLELVVESPELESAWEAFQADGDLSEEEKMARTLHPDPEPLDDEL